MTFSSPNARPISIPGFNRGSPQLTRNGELKHLLTTEGLPRTVINHILDTATRHIPLNDGEVETVPLLHGKLVLNLFFEKSVRIRADFDIAAKRLSADVLDLNTRVSSTSEAESLLNTINNLPAMHGDLFIVRHSQSGAPYLIAKHCAPHEHVINAGDGCHAHPTQGLVDMYTIRHYKQDFQNLTVAIVGDILHSRIARSDIHALATLGVPEIRVIGPRTLRPSGLEQLGVKVFDDMEAGLRGVDVIILLRLQNKRVDCAWLPSTQEYFKSYGLTPQRLALASPDAIVMHAGSIDRGIEIESSVADGMQSVIRDQATFGVPVRMAVMGILAGTAELATTR
ncbi:aspartate carbamoyltransferase catalytic subunit [Burkholderia sp. L27(2015)]|uniref:aspartate carbamoyltransferase catalytic subunit n=1 Tax=Burkholderia sp. L27(2015) TaxID=1641858 RepID=UPI00131AE9AA